LLCDQLEEIREKALDLEFKSLPSITIRCEEMPDPRLAAWVECDKISRTFAYDFPNNGFYIPSCEEYSEPKLFADYLGMHSPLAAQRLKSNVRIGFGCLTAPRARCSTFGPPDRCSNSTLALAPRRCWNRMLACSFAP
jgi:hypothetical protein